MTISVHIGGAQRVRISGADAVGFRSFQPVAHGAATTLTPQVGHKDAPEFPEEPTRGALDGVTEGVVQQGPAQATVRGR